MLIVLDMYMCIMYMYILFYVDDSVIFCMHFTQLPLYSPSVLSLFKMMFYLITYLVYHL